MSLIRKTNPVGVDLIIDRFQAKLWSSLGWTDWNSYPRAYKNLKKDENNSSYLVPEYAETKLDYKELFYDDKITATSFFIKSDESTNSENLIQTSISLIIACDLNKLYPTIPHRADEELKKDVIGISNKFPQVHLTSCVEGLSNVYSEFNQDKITWSDISPRHVVRFNYDVNYVICCSC